MKQVIRNFAGIKAAALSMGYDNGLINRFCSEGSFLDQRDEVVGADGVDLVDLIKINDFLCSLTEEQLNELCNGCEGEPEQEAVLSLWTGDRDMLNGFLNDLFEA